MRLFAILALICCCGLASAEEGMWTPSQLPELAQRLKEEGLEIDPASLADLTSYPMGAVIWLGGCTASFVSDQGLVITNHHCAYGSIQHNSTDEKNILETGFLARSFDEELPGAPGSRVLVTIEVQDVTGQILAAVPEGANGKERYDAIEEAEKKLVAACEEQEGARCRVSSFHGGLQYLLFTQLEIRDVRLVYAPPRSIGKYGGDVDNWMWPRHTGDYSFFRAYVGPDGMPADPSPENIPYRPKNWLKVSVAGVQEGDFVMVAGYPGRTSRYRLADEVENQIHWYYPMASKLYGDLLASIENAVKQYPNAKLKLEPMMAGLNNQTKNYAGMIAGFDQTDVVAAKRNLEAELQAWIAADPDREKKYGTALADLTRLVVKQQKDQERDLYWRIVRRWSLLSAATRLYRLAQERLEPDLDRKPGYQDRDVKRIRERMERMERTYDRRVDRLVAADRIRMYANLPKDRRIAPFDQFFGFDANGVDEGRLNRVLDEIYSKTKLEDLEVRLHWLDASVEEFQASKDPMIRLAVTLYPVDLEMEAEEEALSGDFKDARPRFMEALIAFQHDRGVPVYADANSTLRVTTGHVKGYQPRDGVWYEPFTTLRGLIEKETGVEPFDSPTSLLGAIQEGDYGPYVLEGLNSVPVDFLSTLDTTGGNSGSPTMNGKGELVGLLFDGVWESLLADWYYEPDQARSIHTDLRYMLWIMDRVAGAEHLLREMGVQPSLGE